MTISNFSNTCGVCKYYVDMGHIGECRRYPKSEQKFNLHYCGEFIARPITIIPPQVIEVVETPKKRGRPAKDTK